MVEAAHCVSCRTNPSHEVADGVPCYTPSNEEEELETEEGEIALLLYKYEY